MKAKFSKTWKASKQPRKQRKYIANAPKHIQSKFLHSHLSKELREKHKKRSVRVRTKDKVKVLRGTFKGKTGVVESVDTKNQKVYITKVEYTKTDGSKVKYPIHTSNIMITELNLDDKKRKGKLTPKKEEMRK
ncbi:50S ribosomal protein L24 [Candidatus Woesearchaeota archaeon]|nr:50S ribosomal protein L24 [Candidatus Woesearchaeota archaeon]